MNIGKNKISICSGGQTGVDRAALDAADELGLPFGGYCPFGRRSEDGKIPEKYKMIETPSAHYWERTRMNVIESDATLIVINERNGRGTDLTVKYAKKYKKPCKIFKTVDAQIKEAVKWLQRTNPSILNIAGPRESNSPGIYFEAKKFVRTVLEIYLSSK
ncbi:putative molybdenum carrier protein [candidate division WOR-3 bacterium]|nr:putative molybdenum carrier protein [candidate division WOR-3 bacterium]